MHPQLSDKRISLQLDSADFKFVLCPNYPLVCREFIQALEACHASTWLRLTGGCNGQKHALNKCLHKEVSPPLRPSERNVEMAGRR